MITQDLGIATAYGYAKSKGYTGTETEFAELMASYADVGQTAVTAAQTATTKASEAATSATTATNKATEATTAATTATTKAGEASTSASTATSAKDTAVSASQTATSKATEATTAAATATSAATTATTAKDDAVSAKTAAQTAQTGAETAAASVQSSAAQIQTNADDISELKEDLTINSESLYSAYKNELATIGGYGNTENVTRTATDCASSLTGNAQGIHNGFYAEFPILVTGIKLNTGTTSTQFVLFRFSADNTLISTQDITPTVTDYEFTLPTPIFLDKGEYILMRLIGGTFIYKNDSTAKNPYYNPNTHEWSLNAIRGGYELIFKDAYYSFNSDRFLRIYPNIVTTATIASTLPDANGAEFNTRYYISSRSIPSNMPSLLPSPINVILETYAFPIIGSDTVGGNLIQVLKTSDDKHLWTRKGSYNLSGVPSYSVWESFRHTVVVGDTTKEFSFAKLIDAIRFAYANPFTTIDVVDGTYDIIDELGDELTSSFIGVLLGKNMVLNFSPHAYVVCDYDGDDTSIKTIFSPFYSGVGDFEINNMKLSCSNVRYCVHDEKSDGADAYSHKYNNCSFYIDNSENPYGFPQCIGGGLGKDGHIEIIGCAFKSETISADGEKAEAAYHNSSASGAKSEVIVKDNYFENGTFRISYYGASTERTYAYVSNNAVKYSPYVTQESPSYDLQNVVLKEWNNAIHN